MYSPNTTIPLAMAAQQAITDVDRWLGRAFDEESPTNDNPAHDIPLENGDHLANLTDAVRELSTQPSPDDQQTVALTAALSTLTECFYQYVKVYRVPPPTHP